MKLSTVLNRAADECLWDGVQEKSFKNEDFSCYAIFRVIHESACSFDYSIGLYIQDMGVEIVNANQFDEFASGPERQAARFLWLKFAALVAEDEGL